MKKFAPWVVFGAREPNKTIVGYIDKHKTAHAHICELRHDRSFDYGERIDIHSDLDGEYIHLMFCKKESLYWVIRSLQDLYDKWDEDADA